MTTPNMTPAGAVQRAVTEQPSALTSFFKGSDTKFGIFYPTDYLVAVFSNMTAARTAERSLGFAGVLDEDVIAVPGSEVVLFAEQHLKHTNLWGLLMQQLSRAFATEEIYTKHDLELAESGAWFLAAYCPNEKRKQEAWALIQPSEPVVARHYALSGVEHFKGEL